MNPTTTLEQVAGRNFRRRPSPLTRPQPAVAPIPALLEGRCCVCRSFNRWPRALPGSTKRFFCMKCERNTIHQKVTA